MNVLVVLVWNAFDFIYSGDDYTTTDSAVVDGIEEFKYPPPSTNVQNAAFAGIYYDEMASFLLKCFLLGFKIIINTTGFNVKRIFLFLGCSSSECQPSVGEKFIEL